MCCWDNSVSNVVEFPCEAIWTRGLFLGFVPTITFLLCLWELVCLYFLFLLESVLVLCLLKKLSISSA